MSVLLAHAPVRGPARMADAGCRGARGDRDGGPAGRVAVRAHARLVAGQLGLQRAQVADGAHRLDAVLGDHRDAGAVIAAVLELAQPGEQQIARGTLTYISDNAAHCVEDTSAQRPSTVDPSPESFPARLGKGAGSVACYARERPRTPPNEGGDDSGRLRPAPAPLGPPSDCRRPRPPARSAPRPSRARAARSRSGARARARA